MMKTKALSRRAVLRGTIAGATVSLALPRLDIMLNDHGTAYADDSNIPTRFLMLFHGNGYLTERWIPSATGQNFALPTSLQAFDRAGLRDYLTVASNLKCTARGSAHWPAGINSVSGHFASGGGTAGHGRSEGPSIETVLGDAIGQGTAVRAFRVGNSTRGFQEYDNDGNCSFNDNGDNIRPEYDVRRMWDQVFGGFTPPQAPSEGTSAPTTPTANPRQNVRRRILDAIMGDAQALKRQRLGQSDKQKLDNYLDLQNDILTGLDSSSTGGTLAGCSPPDKPSDSMHNQFNDRFNEKIKNKHEVISQIIAAAFACDRTRSVMYQFSRFQNYIQWKEIDSAAGANGTHAFTHIYENWDGSFGSDADERNAHEQLKKINDYQAEMFASLAKALHNYSEGDGTLLDNALIMTASELSTMRAHSTDSFCTLFIGGAKGRLQKGVHKNYNNNKTTVDALLTGARAVGASVNSIGGGEHRSTSPLDLLV